MTVGGTGRICLLAFLATFVGQGQLLGHPVPRMIHECTVEVQLTPRAVVVNYRLDVDETTAQLDLKDLLTDEEWRQLDSPRAFFQAYTRVTGPLLAENLYAQVDGQKRTFSCLRSEHKVVDHLQCEFVFSADWNIADGKAHRFTFRDGNYDQDQETGRVRVRLSADPGLTLSERVAPDAVLLARLPLDLHPGDDARLRRVSALAKSAVPPPAAEPPTPAPPANRAVDLPTVVGLFVVLAAGLGALLRRCLRTAV